jgi:hypothetical protein
MQPKRTTPIRRRGFRVVGPGFYLWDLDEREVQRVAADLRGRHPRLRAPTAREAQTPLQRAAPS